LEDNLGEQEGWSYYQIEVMCGGHKIIENGIQQDGMEQGRTSWEYKKM
jgi:hypothetical protein